MNNKAQSSLEYLLLIAGVVLVATIVVITMINTISTPQDATEFYQHKYEKLEHLT
ncbi:MAG: hypothetical protein COX63_03465 [Candidatus Diapherotrites archaeon CG_4_10_14_0_2_um_filter_31_5]|nr:MAG: hypothetical protein COX63_03465 [Candidatus Diapherotrites archaeon CG_4_10_14_0_2_um_filter_31_5]